MCKRFVCSVLFVLVLGLAGSAWGAVLYSDSFDRPDSDALGTNDNALGGIVTAPWVEVEGNPAQIGISGNAYSAQGGNNNGYIDHKFTSAELGASFTIEFDVMPAAQSNEWFNVQFGPEPASFTTSVDVNQNRVPFGFLFRAQTGFRMWDSAVLVGVNNTDIIDNSTDPARVTLEFDSPDGYSEGNTATVRLRINDVLVEDLFGSGGSHDFEWDNHTDGLYISFENNGALQKMVDNMVISNSLSMKEAVKPSPENEATDVLRETVLSWVPGEFAEQHDVYFGTVFNDVNDATTAADPAGVYVGRQSDTTYVPGRLDLGQIYYWRVDEVNAAPDNTVFKGDVWSFEVEPVSIPVINITATASSSHDADMVPEKTIDGSGLDALDQHSNEPRHMWLSGMGDPVPSIQYEFDVAYKLHEMWVWNSNQAIESFIGLGAKDVTIETSANGTDWTQLEEIPPFAQAPGQAAYAHNTVIDLGGVVAQYVRLTIDAGYGMLPQSGLSEVRFLYIPTNAREAQPADGDTTDTVDVALTWRAGREAASHEVFLGTDPNALALAATVSDNHYSPTELNYATTYYWQIVEVNDAEDPAAHAGPVWSFSTAPYGIVDEFDQYNDNCERIFFAWEDGLGHNGGEGVDNCDVAPSNGNGGGSIVGHAQSPFAERTIVHAGSQSLPLEYDNAFGPSEATLSFDSQDWSAHGTKSLSLFFRGDPANTGQLYVKINNTKVSYDGLADALQRDQWTPWNIDLSAVGGNLQAVTGLTIGVDGATAAGMLYVDDIRLYPLAPEVITPVDPGAANLVAYYPFDGDYQDASGNNRHGAPVGGNPSFAPGVQGQALNLNAVTITEHIEIAGYKGIVADQTDPVNPIQAAFTVACWINTMDNGSLVFWGSGDGAPVGGQYQNFRIDGGRLRSEHGNGRFRGASTVNDGEWHHVALAVDTGTNMVPPGTRIFVDGMQDAEGADTVNSQNIWNITADVDMAIGARTTAGDRLFVGLLDEVRVYDRALTNGEIASLAGLDQPFDRPFD